MTKDIYGIYDVKEKEQCVFVGEFVEIFKILNITARKSRILFEAIRNKKLIKDRYEVCLVYKERS